MRHLSVDAFICWARYRKGVPFGFFSGSDASPIHVLKNDLIYILHKLKEQDEKLKRLVEKTTAKGSPFSSKAINNILKDKN